MTANQRRPGFRLPWSSETDGPEGPGEPAATSGEATSAASADPSNATDGATPSEPAAAAATTRTESSATSAEAAPSGPPAAEPSSPGAASSPVAAPAQPVTSELGAGEEFMRGLVAAMRKVADESRQHGLEELRAKADEHVRQLEADAERRREDLRQRAEADVAGVGEWARAEAERIKAEAEQRVVARRAQLDQQLAGDTARTEAETKALRDRVAEYERELEAFHAQLAEINDPAAFAAAAKRMPLPPKLGAAAGSAPAPAAAPAPATDTPAAAELPVEPTTAPSNGVAAAAPEVHPAEEEVLAARLAELDAALPDTDAATAVASEPVTTEIVVKGLGSFGAITGFRQSLAGVEGIDGVALSLGQTGEFVFRATHRPGFDVRDAIGTLEGEGAKIEDRPEGGLKVTLDRAR